MADAEEALRYEDEEEAHVGEREPACQRIVLVQPRALVRQHRTGWTKEWIINGEID